MLLYPPGTEQISDNRLFGMYHANTPDHNKKVIHASLQDAHGTVRVVFATVALGMGVNLVGVNTIWHYGAPTCIEDYFQESGDVVDEVESKQSQLCYGDHPMFPCERTKVLLQMQSLPLSDVMWRIQQSVVECSCYVTLIRC